MKPLYGEYECKVDAKGRFLFPAALLKQLPEDDRSAFVLNKGMDKCLCLFPEAVWEAELQKIYARNRYQEKNRAFARMFQSGATPTAPDAQNRILIPKRLAAYAEIESKIVLFGAFDRIEIWDAAVYENWLASQDYNLKDLSEEVMGTQNDGGTDLP